MDCQTIDKFVEDFERGEAEKLSWDDLRQHCDECRRCREKYTGILGGESASTIRRSRSQNMRHAVPLRDTGADRFPDISKPIEFKEAPISFKRYFNDREEEIKIVEPQVDVPLPEESRLVVHEGEDCLCDVVFDFNPRSNRPYELRFRVMMGVAYPTDHLVTFGMAAELDEDLQSVYRLTVVDRGGVRADIEMTGGKARLQVVYKPLQT
jgi:hypothetical protein